MAAYAASIVKARSCQTDLLDHAEHCSVDPHKLATIGCMAGQQVRVRRNVTQVGLYTVSEIHPESPDSVVRMGLAGRRRLDCDCDEEFAADVDGEVTRSSLKESEARTAGEFIERLRDNGTHTGLIAIAPHGGAIEPHTDEQAERVATRLEAKGVSAWRCKGWNLGEDGAGERWHITSTDINPASFPRLARVSSRGFANAVAFHGFKQPGILIGGTAPMTLKEALRAAIEDATSAANIAVEIAAPCQNYGGDDPRNIVNRLTVFGAFGIQIEQSPEARSGHWREIADAVADVYDPLLAATQPPAQGPLD
jgi:phage replication-related protein YjqB (UPF0714/DUF867 family)